MELSLPEVESKTLRIELRANPVNASQATSPWLTARPLALAALRKVIGKSYYWNQAHAGACTWLNSVYWVRVLGKRPNGLVEVENLHDVGDIKVKLVHTDIEPDFVYPLLRGQDVRRWSAQPKAHILMVQDPIKRVGYEESWLKMNYRHTYAYLEEFEGILRKRSGYKKYFDPQTDPFYSMYDVAEYTFEPYKVMWRRMVGQIDGAVTHELEDDCLGSKTPMCHG